MSVCGPSNALNKLSQHSQVDRSLHQDAQRRFAPSGVESFKSNGHQNHQIDLEFQQHQQQQQFQPQGFNPIFANAFGKQQPNVQHHAGPSSATQRPMQNSWAADFNAQSMMMNHHQQPQHQYSTHQMNGGWANDFHAFQQQPQQAQAMQSTTATSSIATPRSFTNLTQLSGLNMTQASIQQFRTEHQELHHRSADLLDKELESEFMKLEQEFQNTSLQEQPQQPQQQPVEKPVFKRSNSDFANAAMQVVDAMNTQNSAKFKQSKFLSLMNMVAQGKVELNDDETKLVDQQGQDILEEQQASSGNPLPDPLEGIANGELKTPFQAAQLVGQNHDEKYTWNDVYDDYRNDDTNF